MRLSKPSPDCQLMYQPRKKTNKNTLALSIKEIRMKWEMRLAKENRQMGCGFM